jgi:glucose/arabinose dehydrogenase
VIAAAPAVIGWPAGSTPQAPLNFKVQAYARGLAAPESLLVLPNGDVLVVERGGDHSRLTLLRAGRGAESADRQFVLLEVQERLHGLTLRRGRLYVGQGKVLLTCPFLVGQNRQHVRCKPVHSAADESAPTETLRDIAFSPDETNLYATGGSSVVVLDPGTTAARVHGKVAGDPWALAFEPVTGVPWVAVERGPAAAGDFLAAVRGGAAKLQPRVELGPSAAPRGLVFYQRMQFPRAYRGGAFVALHGGKVVFVPFKAGKPAGAVQDFLTGFVEDGEGGAIHGRPAAVAVATDGTLLVADDGAGTIWRVSFKCGACTPDPPLPRARARAGTTPH